VNGNRNGLSRSRSVQSKKTTNKPQESSQAGLFYVVTAKTGRMKPDPVEIVRDSSKTQVGNVTFGVLKQLESGRPGVGQPRLRRQLLHDHRILPPTQAALHRRLCFAIGTSETFEDKTKLSLQHSSPRLAHDHDMMSRSVTPPFLTAPRPGPPGGPPSPHSLSVKLGSRAAFLQVFTGHSPARDPENRQYICYQLTSSSRACTACRGDHLAGSRSYSDSHGPRARPRYPMIGPLAAINFFLLIQQLD
jgi:hypothetical protein